MVKKKALKLVSVTLRDEDISQLDEWAHQTGISRSAVIRQLIELRKNNETNNN